ncbi:hypothetical protein D3C72_2204630 [compost metagenome]
MDTDIPHGSDPIGKAGHGIDNLQQTEDHPQDGDDQKGIEMEFSNGIATDVMQAQTKEVE